MALDIRIAQFFKLQAANGQEHYYQNYFANETISYGGKSYSFAPFRAEGTTASLNGDNNVLQVLFPNVDFAVQLLCISSQLLSQLAE